MATPQRYWIDEAVGYPCLILKSPLGTLNGYVAVSNDHPWYGIGYGECPRRCGDEGCDHRPEARIEVHGGLTYAGRGIVEDLDLWVPPALHWFGFHTAHADEAYVAHECHRLAAQLSALVQ